MNEIAMSFHFDTDREIIVNGWCSAVDGKFNENELARAYVLGSKDAFEDMNNPRPVIKAGEENSKGVLEITDMIFATRAPGELHMPTLT